MKLDSTEMRESARTLRLFRKWYNGVGRKRIAGESDADHSAVSSALVVAAKSLDREAKRLERDA